MRLIRLGVAALVGITVFCAFVITGFLLWKHTGLVGSEETYKRIALSGLGIGVIAAVPAQALLAPRFYLLSGTVLTAVYVLLLGYAIALGMGVPVGCPLLGALVGAYAARRASLLGVPPSLYRSSLRRVTLRTVTVSTGVLALLWSVTAVRAAKGLETGVPDFTGNRALSHVLFLLAAVILAPALQALVTLAVGRFGFERWSVAEKRAEYS